MRTTRIKWQNATDSRLRNLAEDRAMEIYPELDDVWSEHDGSIECIFVSTGAEIYLGDPYSGQTQNIFLYGHCAMLAYAIHERTGLPFAVMDTIGKDGYGWSGHIAIKVSDDAFLDIRGLNTAEELTHGFHSPMTAPVEMGKDEFLQKIVDEAVRDNPIDGMLDELEALIVWHFADLLIKTHLS